MQKDIEHIFGNTQGIGYEFPVFRFAGSDAGAPSAYIQAALHGDELPGAAAIDALMPHLRQAEADGRIRGRLTIVPWCNPIGRSQYLFGDVQGRFDLGGRENFNRNFPLLERPDVTILNSNDPALAADMRLKQRLLQLSVGHDIVLDLHCDDEGVPYLYVPKVLWPAMADIASAMRMEAVVLWDGSSGASFDEASIHPYLRDDAATLARRAVTTVEYRGVADVSPDIAASDAEGLYRVLVARGVVEDGALRPPEQFTGLAAPVEHVEVVRSPVAGMVLFHVLYGDHVAEGQRLATIVHAPAEERGSIDVLAPQAGFILTRTTRRAIHTGGDLVKLVGARPSATARPGALED